LALLKNVGYSKQFQGWNLIDRTPSNRHFYIIRNLGNRAINRLSTARFGRFGMQMVELDMLIVTDIGLKRTITLKNIAGVWSSCQL